MAISKLYAVPLVDGASVCQSNVVTGPWDNLDAALALNQHLVAEHDGVFMEKATPGSAYYGASAGLYFSGKVYLRYPVPNGDGYQFVYEILDSASCSNFIPLDNGQCVVANIRTSPPGGTTAMTYDGYSATLTPASGHWGIVPITALTPGKYVIPVLWRAGDAASDQNPDGSVSGGSYPAMSVPLARWRYRGGNNRCHRFPPFTLAAAATSKQLTLPNAPPNTNFQVMIDGVNAAALAYDKANRTGYTKATSAPHITIAWGAGAAGTETFEVAVRYW